MQMTKLLQRGVTGLVLAAGRGRRFDPSGIHNKLLQPLPDGRPVIVAGIDAMRGAGLDAVVAVVPPDSTALCRVLISAGARVVECATADSGMAESLKAGILATSPTCGWVVALGDMPFVRASTIAQLAHALCHGDGTSAVVPWFGHRRGNPVAFPVAWRQRLLGLSGDEGARHLLSRNPSLHLQVQVQDAGILRDVDRPEDLSGSGNDESLV